MDCKSVSDTVTSYDGDTKFGSTLIPPRTERMFFKFREVGVKIVAFTAAKLTMTYGHECISSLINSAGVKST